MGKLTTLIVSLLLFGCTPKIDSVSYQDAFKKWNRDKEINEVDSTASMSIDFNTYKGFFEGRIESFGFRKNHYYIDFKKIDTLYTERDIEKFSVIGSFDKDPAFIPKHCKVRINHISKDKVFLEFEIRDESLPDVLTGKFKLKLSTEFPEHYDVFKYYEN